MPYFNHALFPVKIASNIDFPHLEGHLACDQFDSLQLRNLLEFGQTRNVRLVDLFFHPSGRNGEAKRVPLFTEPQAGFWGFFHDFFFCAEIGSIPPT